LSRDWWSIEHTRETFGKRGTYGVQGGDHRAFEAPEVAKRGTTPTGVAVFTAHDITIRRLAERDHNIVHWTEFDRGGHFAAMEVPDLLVGDVREFFQRFR